MNKTYRYKSLTQNEQIMSFQMIQGITTNAEILIELEKQHNQGNRIAVIVEVTNGELGEFGYMQYEDAIDRFPFSAVKNALDMYDPKDSLCLISVRGQYVAAEVVGSGLSNG